MSYESARDAILARFDAQWASATPIEWPNRNFTKPSGKDPWVRIIIQDGEAFQASFGNSGANVHRHPGVIQLQVFTKMGIGNARALELADDAAAIFRGASFSGVRCRAASVREIGPDGHGWYQVNVTVPFWRDSTF